MNQERYQKIIDQIREHPESWNQKVYHSGCGTKHCIAGWAHLHKNSGVYELPYDVSDVLRDAKEWLELTPAQALYLFSSTRTLEHLVHGYQDGYNFHGTAADGHGYSLAHDMTYPRVP